MFRCNDCKFERETQWVKCPKCNKFGTAHYIQEQSPVEIATVKTDVPVRIPSPVLARKMPFAARPKQGAAGVPKQASTGPAPKAPMSSGLAPKQPASKAAVSSRATSPRPALHSTQPRPVAKSGAPLIPSTTNYPGAALNPASGGQRPAPKPAVIFRINDAGRVRAAEIQQKFKTKGVFVRSIQLKHVECVNAPLVAFDPRTRSVAGMYCDAWTLSHPTIPQRFFQMGGEEAKRAISLIVDWTATDDRIVRCSAKDASTNKTFGPKDLAMTPDEAEAALADLLLECKGMKDHNEVNICQVARASLVGLIWSPIERPTILSDGTNEWQTTRPKVQRWVTDKLKPQGAATNGLPVFTYAISATEMTLTYLDFLP